METMYLNYFTHDSSFPFFIQYGYHDTDLFIHDHADFSELLIVLNGTAIHKVNNESYFIKKGDVFVINHRTVHGFVNTNDFHICNIMFRPEHLQSLDFDIRKSAGYHALFVIEPYLTMERNFQSRLKLQLTEFEQVSNLIASMIKEYDMKTDGWKTILNSYFMMLVVLLSRSYSLPSSEMKSEVINIAKSVSYIEKNYTNPISIEMLAKMSNLSVRHFTRIFRDTYQTSPGNYINNLKMQHACMLLTKTTLNISEVAFQSGFSDSNYFTRQFKKLFQVTPKEYRNQEKNNRSY